MTYQGYMALANDLGTTLELVNAARVKAYTDNLAPTLGLRGCEDCEGLEAALGETYSTPAEDNAPWYDPTIPDTADFYGVYPLNFEGIDDSTRVIESAELTGDGSVVVGSRYTGKDIRVQGMAFAKTEAALYEGVSWLDSALNGTEEGRCFGDRLNVFASCPPVEDLPEDFATPYTQVNPPSAAELAAWTTTSGPITSSAGGVDFAWTDGDPLKVACREITGLIPGEQYQLRFRPQANGNYYVSISDGCAERYTNLLPDPRLTAINLTTNGSTSVDTRPSTGAPDGGSYFSRLIVAINTTSPMIFFLTGTGTSAIPVVGDESYTFSWYAQKIGAGGPSSRLDYIWYDPAGTQIGIINSGSSNSPGATWTRYSETIVAPPGAAYLQPRLAWSGIAVAGQTLNVAQTMLNIGTSAPDYIDGDYPEARWLGTTNASASSVSRNVDEETIFGWQTVHNPPTEPTVLDFIARESTAYLSVQSLAFAGAAPTTVLQVQQSSVRRVAHPGVVAFGTGNDAVAPSDGWTHLAPAAMRVDWSILQSSIRTTATNPSGGVSTYLTSHGPQRTLYGLTPGSRYRLMIEFQAFYRSTGVAASAALVPQVSISNSSGQFVAYTDDNPGSFQYFWVIEFTATATSSVLLFHPAANLAMGSSGDVFWQFDEYMVEEVMVTDTVPPQPGRNQARTMYEVKASQGPVLTNLRRVACGVMAQVTYSLRAGKPFKYRSPVFAGGLPSGPSQVVADTPCSDDGLPQIVNYAYNPSLEVDATDWATGGISASGARTASASAVVGDFLYRASAPNTPGNRLNEVTAYYLVSNVTGGPIPLPGDTITVSIYFRPTIATWFGTYTWSMQVTSTGFPPLSAAGSQVANVLNQWYRIEQTFTLPFNVPLEVIEVHVNTPVAITQGGGMDVDGFQIERGPVATQVFDQTVTGVEWSATAGSSALLRDQTAVDISTDPDCPAPPAPPAPPEIDDSCVDSPTTYTRTVVSISENTVPRNLTAYPIITLTAGSADVRQARIRFWENPLGLNIDDLDPCSYEGEIIVSYLAAGATMTIDGVLQEAEVSLAGFDTQDANHVLYGPDGGPVQWPELSGGIPYLVTLELDSTAPYTDTLMLVDLVVKD